MPRNSRFVPMTVLATLLLTGAACGGDESTPGSGGSPPATSAAPEGASAPTSVLDGTWDARITRDAVIRYCVAQGVSRAAARRMIEVDFPGEGFQLRVLGGSFNVVGPTGESWISGSFRLEGDRFVIEEPGHADSFLHVDLDGDRVRFEMPGRLDRTVEHLPGVPEVVAGGALWSTAPWVRRTSG